MYAAKLEKTRYTFEASGSLWKDALVMLDRQTGSLWSQISGKCIEGSSLGLELELFPSEFLTFAALKEKYPQAKLLDKPKKGDAGSHYDRYFSDPNRLGMFGHTYELGEEEGKQRALAFRIGRDAVALPIDKIEKPAAAVVRQMERAAVVFFDPETGESVAYSISNENADQGKLKVEMNGSVTFHDKTVTVAGLKSGKAPQSDQFEALPLITAYWFAWKSFFPNAQIVNLTQSG